VFLKYNLRALQYNSLRLPIPPSPAMGETSSSQATGADSTPSEGVIDHSDEQEENIVSDDSSADDD